MIDPPQTSAPPRGTIPPASTTTLPGPEWRARQAAHLARVRTWTEPHRARAARGEKHPVHDFLWHYYSLRPAQLERWHPGLGYTLAPTTEAHALAPGPSPGYVESPEGVTADPRTLSPRRLDSVRWIASLLRACEARPAAFSCFGLHEWAMVYRSASVRHADTPLRLAPHEIAEIIEALPVRCTHFDAFRFFTPAARPLNRVQPAPDTRLALEQRGCVHVTMDLYKWAAKLLPFVASELLADCFELALAARELDMRASPYDMRHLGYEPVRIETPEGRADYEREQRALAARAAPLRSRLIEYCDRIVAAR